MKYTFFTIVSLSLLALSAGCQRNEIHTRVADRPTTFCNPLNLNYRFGIIEGREGIREAADPVVVPYGGNYYLFASKSSGYWKSADMGTWEHVFIPDSVLPIEDYAPAAAVHDGYIYYMGAVTGDICRSQSPESGQWEKVATVGTHFDPALYFEGDRLYMYYGCSPCDPIYVQELDPKTFGRIGERMACLNSDKERRGWERRGERNELGDSPWIEGAWMTKYKGRYYLQYSAPGTEWKSYADGVYTASSACGPFTYEEYSPVSYKPTGFTGGAGHGCLFQIGDGYWKAATTSVSVRQGAERRVSLFPAGFDDRDEMYTDTYLGDYPLFLPSGEQGHAVRPEWMLLSYKKPVTTSSLHDGKAENIVDEDCRTSWVAESNKKEEWVEIDLGKEQEVCAIQVNYDEYGASQKGYTQALYEAYVLQASHDGQRWSVVADKADKRTDNPHDYVEFARPFKARYIRWENRGYNISANVSLREIRVFGKSGTERPACVGALECNRNAQDRCRMMVDWEPVEGADGYIIRAGVSPDNLFHNYQVYDSTQYELKGLNADAGYYIAIDAFNEGGVTKGSAVWVQ